MPRSRLLLRAALAALLIASPVLLQACSSSGKGGRPVRKALGAVLAKVNGQPIDQVSTDRLIKMIQMQGFTPPPETAGATPEEKVRNFAIERLIDRELALGDAYKRGLKADSMQVSQAFDRMKMQLAQDSTLAQGQSEADMRQNLADDLIVNDYFQKTVIDSLTVPEAELKQYFDQNPQMFMAPERVHARHILIMSPEGDPAEKRAVARRKAESVLADARKPGADFAGLAQTNSDDTNSAQNGGDLGDVPRGQTVKPFEDALFALQPGELSGVVETAYGYHIIRAEERKAAEQMSLDSVKPQLQEFLKNQKVQGAIQARLDALRKTAKIEMSKPS